LGQILRLNYMERKNCIKVYDELTHEKNEIEGQTKRKRGGRWIHKCGRKKKVHPNFVWMGAD